MSLPVARLEEGDQTRPEKVRDIVRPNLHIDTLKVKSRNFQ